MALRKPLVLNAGLVQQLQSGDTLDAVQSGGDAVIQTNANAGSIVIGAPVYSSANNSVDKAQGNAAATSKVLGLVRDTSIGTGATGAIQINGILTATTGQWDAVFGTTGGLTVNTRYYVSASTAGLGTDTAPSTVGQYVIFLGTAISTTDLNINIESPVLL